MQKALLKSGTAAVFAVALIGMTGLLTGATLDLGSVGSWLLTDYAPQAGALALLAAVALGGRGVDSYEAWELVAVGVALGLHAVMFLGEPVSVVDAIANNQPWAGLLATVVSYVGFHRVMWG